MQYMGGFSNDFFSCIFITDQTLSKYGRKACLLYRKGEIMNKNNHKTYRRPFWKQAVMAGTIFFAAACMVLGFAIPALANSDFSYGNGSVVVETFEDQDTTFKAFRIFMATQNEDGSLSNFAWASNDVRDAVISAIRQFVPTYSSLEPKSAAEFISTRYRMMMDEYGENSQKVLEAKELLNKIAAAVDDTADYTELEKGVTTELPEGYWLIVTDGDSVGTDESGTSPIFAIFSGGPIHITEKRSIPTVDKQILNDADGAEYSYGAEAQIGQEVTHLVTGTVANNISTYDLYYYAFEDVMSKGIDYVSGSYQVKIDGTDVTGSFTEQFARNADGSGTLSIACEDLLAISDVQVNADSRIELTYSVKLNDDCVVGAAGNPNDVCIHYSSNPNTREKSKTHTVRDYLYTFGLHLEKKDRDVNLPLAGAKFTIQATNPDDAASQGLYVQADGRLGNEPYEFVTNADGSIEVTGLDAGSYTLKETQTPEMYQTNTDTTTVTIAAAYNEDGTLKSISNTVSDNADAAAGIDTSDDHIVNGDADTAVNAATGIVNVTIGNIQKVRMPLSGESGIVLLIAVGIGAVAISAAGLILAGRKAKNQGH